MATKRIFNIWENILQWMAIFVDHLLHSHKLHGPTHPCFLFSRFLSLFRFFSCLYFFCFFFSDFYCSFFPGFSFSCIPLCWFIFSIKIYTSFWEIHVNIFVNNTSNFKLYKHLKNKCEHFLNCMNIFKWVTHIKLHEPSFNFFWSFSKLHDHFLKIRKHFFEIA